MKAEALSRKPGVVGAVAFSRSGDPATGDFGDAKLIRKLGDVPDLRAVKPSGSAFQVELAAQPVCNRFDHFRALLILWSIRHDRDLPGVLAGHDRDG
jgi:hypothetical protein